MMSESIPSHEIVAEQLAAKLSDESASPRIADLVEAAASRLAGRAGARRHRRPDTDQLPQPDRDWSTTWPGG